MKILVYGAGVLGSLYAARLYENGEDVTILARGRRLADLREYGIVLEDALTGERTATRVPVIERLAPQDAYDLVLVLTRRNQLPAVLPVLAANPNTPNVLFMLNNAAGPDEWVEALGRERVLLGFPGAGGTREGRLVRYHVLPRRQQATTIGELDGRCTPRLERVVRAFEGAGFPVETSSRMDDWLKAHATWITAVACALYMVGGDIRRMARTRDAMVLMVRAIHEGFGVLRALGIAITPSRLKIFEWLPEPLLIAFLKRLFDTETAELVIARHANAARDEARELAGELEALAYKAAVPIPETERLYRHIDSSYPIASEGSAEIPLRWRGLWVGMSTLVGLALAGVWVWPRVRRWIH